MKAEAFFARAGGASPMTHWVDQPEIKAGPQGYIHYQVTVSGFIFQFASLYELDVCVQTLSKKNLPPSSPNGHWLSRLPGWVKTWRYREKAVKALLEARRLFVKLGDRIPTYTTPSEMDLRRRQRDHLPASMGKRTAQNKNYRQAVKQLSRKRLKKDSKV